MTVSGAYVDEAFANAGNNPFITAQVQGRRRRHLLASSVPINNIGGLYYGPVKRA